MTVLRSAVAGARQVEIEYYAFGRDEWTRRVVDPYSVFSAAGQWYLSAWCHLVEDERLFRVDRMRSAELTGTGFSPPSDRPSWPCTSPAPKTPGSCSSWSRRRHGWSSSTRWSRSTTWATAGSG